MLIQKDGRWVFVSRKTRRPLAYYKGNDKPPEEWVRKQEQRVQYFKQMNEAAYSGNVGFQELVKFHSKASPEQKKMLNSHIQNKKHKEFRDLIKNVIGVQLHKSVNEESKPDILPIAGAGQWGTPELTRNYIEGTPGQKVKRFKRYIKNI